MPEYEAESFIKTPLEFFGHSYEDIHFGYPQEFYDEMNEAKESRDSEIAGYEARRAELAAGATVEPNDKYVSTDDEYAATLAYANRRHTQDVNHKWYEKRFRGRYASNVDMEQFPHVEQFVGVINKWKWEYDPEKYPLPNPLPDANEFAGYFNEAIRLNEWSSVHWEALEWYKALPEESPDRETAKNYLAFAGNIVLQEYCKIAVSLAHDKLADDDFVSVKHLLTVCWPMAMRLEPFIPEEVKRSKQLLRETFLQMAARGNSSFRSHVELFGWATLGHDPNSGLDSRDELEKQAYTALMAFDDNESGDSEAIKTDLLYRANKLVDEKKWDVAIDVLELATHAYGWDIAEFQPLIDQYAVEGALYYTSDMSKMHEMWSYRIGKHEHWTCNAYMVDELRRAPGISSEAYQKIFDIEELRGFEYEIRKLSEASEDEKNTIVGKLFYSLAKAEPDVAQRFADPEIIDCLMNLLLHESTGRLSDQATDELVVSVIQLRNNGVLNHEQQNNALTVIGEHVMSRARDPEDYDSFGRFIGFISPIMRKTKATEMPEDEVVWKFISPKQFETFMKNIRGRAYERSRAGQHSDDLRWLQDQQFAFLKDIRKAWNEYWDVREDY